MFLRRVRGNCLSFIHFNARSLKAEQNVIDDLNLIDYSAYHVTRETRKGGGVALYIRNELSCRLLETKTMIFLMCDRRTSHKESH